MNKDRTLIKNPLMNASDAYKKTLSVYDDPSFALMYFERWRNDLPIVQLEEFSRQMGTSGLVLDAGCGPGHHTSFLNKLNHRTIGIDQSHASLKLATTSFLDIEFVRCDMLQMPFKDHLFSGVWACASLMHLPENLMQEQLREFRRILADGGFLAVTMTLEKQSHVDLYGRFFQSYPSVTHLINRLKIAGFEIKNYNNRFVTKTTEADTSTAEWVTIIARRL